MQLRTTLKKAALSKADGLRVSDVRIGLAYTAVELSNAQVGLAYTFRDQLSGGCGVFETLRPLAGRSAAQLLALFDSQDCIESAIALATANAIFNSAESRYLSGSALQQISLRREDRVAMVGNFAPMVAEIRPQVSRLDIFELIAKPEENILSIDSAPRLLPDCQVALLSATSIINNTIDHLLELTRSCREVLLLGPSTPLVLTAFQDTPVTLLSGVSVAAPKAILQTISEGGGVHAFKSSVKKVNLIAVSEAG